MLVLRTLPARFLSACSWGVRSTSVTVPAGTTLCFRYLGEHMAWFDDADASPCEHGGSITV